MLSECEPLALMDEGNDEEERSSNHTRIVPNLQISTPARVTYKIFYGPVMLSLIN
jgi:hypothetical protein